MPAPESQPDPRTIATERAADWEAFYRDYRKPGYVSGFELTTKLGGGMFGLVYRARKQSIGKDYAIKFLQVDDTEVRRAVLAELEQVKYFAQIDHPNLVSIEDRGEVDGIPYLVMSFAGTETLRDRMPGTGKPPTAAERDELVRYFLQCCRGLVALHERSLVHFDIKPANVFLKGSVARLGDYGLSKLVTHSRGSLSMGRGTPYYMAPEMLQRRGDARSDIYSLGVMLYEILCGKVPFTGDSEWEVLRKHEKEAPVLPAHLSVVERSVLQRCLQKDPAARFASVNDVIAAFGSTPSVAAAALASVRTATGTAAMPSPARSPTGSGPNPTPPPLPAVPPPLVEDHLAGLGLASRVAARHAKAVAAEALVKARVVVKDVHGALQQKVKDVVAKDRSRPVRRWRTWRRLHQLRKSQAQRRQLTDLARAVAAREQPRRRGRWLSVLGTLFVLFVVALGLLFVLLAPVRVDPTPVASAASPSWARASIYTRYTVPPGFEDAVSLAEPGWVELSRLDRGAARRQLLDHIERLREVAPLSADERGDAAAVPTFGLSLAHVAAIQQADEVVAELLRAEDYRTDLAARVRNLGAHGLVSAALALSRVEWQGPADVERASRLHRLLCEASSCRDILWLTGAQKDLGRSNRHLGPLWVWFTNEFAHNERTWATFLALMKRQ